MIQVTLAGRLRYYEGMAKSKKKTPPPSPPQEKKTRNFPKHSLEQSLVLAQKIYDEMGGQPMNRLLLADALSVSPSSSQYRDLLSSSYKYGLTDGTEKSDTISLTALGQSATQAANADRLRALRTAVLRPSGFGTFLRDFNGKKLPSTDMLPKILQTRYQVPADMVVECAKLLEANGRFVEIIREISGSPHILLDVEYAASPAGPADEVDDSSSQEPETFPLPAVLPGSLPAQRHGEPRQNGASGATATPSNAPKPIFVGHGKNKQPLDQLHRLLSTFQIPHKIVVDEANLGRPIPQKVRDTINECGSAILIFTKDEKFFDGNGGEVWRPSENVVHELGATSFAYGDRIVIFKEKGLHFPTNFQSIGYIEFEPGDLTARTADLLKELIGFGLVRVTPTQ